MVHKYRTSFVAACTILTTAVAFADTPNKHYHIPFPRLGYGLVKTATRGRSGMGKLSTELRNLVDQMTGPRPKTYFTPAQLKSRFGIDAADPQPRVLIAIRTVPGAAPSTDELGVSQLRTAANVIYARAAVASLKAVAADSGVLSVDVMKAAAYPPGVETVKPRFRPHIPARGEENVVDFDHAGLTGKGVIVGIVDSGIDWKHGDFRNADGTTRILDIWDVTDDSWAVSKGKIGSEPPIKDKSGAPIGTLYTKEQIDAAIAGTGVVKSLDIEGHGSACAGTAAGNGLGTGNGKDTNTYVGVAPEADLIMVKAGDGGASPLAPFGTAFIVDTAAKLGKPCVISHSYGSHDSGHDGTDPEEQMLDSLAGGGKPGVVLCAAAGNEGRETLHARARFGPVVDGQADVVGDPIELFVQSKTELAVYLNHADDWGLGIEGMDKFLISATGKPDIFYLVTDGANLRGFMDKPAKLPANFAAFFNSVLVNPSADNKEDIVTVPLPPGRYLIFACGAGKKVESGVADFYLPFHQDASFGMGSDKEYMVSTPGDAANVITVGAYYFRHAWKNLAGNSTTYNLPDGDICTYSDPGYRRDGAVKPEIAAPASYTISTLATGAAIAEISKGVPDKTVITPDGAHLAWAGTSAASPYVAGVIALMLQKNPTLDEDQVRKILETTAKSDSFTGATPNSRWGYGKIDPAAAIAAVETPPAAAPSTGAAP